MQNSKNQTAPCSSRRRRQHELLIALIEQQEDLELIDAEAPSMEGGNSSGQNRDPARWLERNRRVLMKYQALVRSAVTLDALMESEQGTT